MTKTLTWLVLVELVLISFTSVPTEAQNKPEWVELTRGTGTLVGSNPDWILFPIDVTQYPEGSLKATVFVEPGTGISRTGGKCMGKAQFSEEGFFDHNYKEKAILPNQTALLLGNFSKPTKFTLGVISVCRPELNSKFEYVIYIRNEQRISATAAQGKGTCLINNKVTYDCDLSKFKDTCMYNGQILPCNKTPEKSCGDSGLLIIKLNEATKYYERSTVYEDMNLYLVCRGIATGFFGAASDVTHDLSADWFGIGEEGDAFLKSVSTKLAQMNVLFFKELVDTGKLKTADGSAYLTDAAKIDRELVKREQALVQEEYDKLSAANKAPVTQQINAKIRKWIWSTSPSAKAMAQVRDSKRRTNPEAEFDYSNINDRIAVGNILAEDRRKNPIRIPL